MENIDERETEAYINKLNNILEAKKKAISGLRKELKTVQHYQSKKESTRTSSLALNNLVT